MKESSLKVGTITAKLNAIYVTLKLNLIHLIPNFLIFSFS